MSDMSLTLKLILGTLDCWGASMSTDFSFSPFELLSSDRGSGFGGDGSSSWDAELLPSDGYPSGFSQLDSDTREMNTEQQAFVGTRPTAVTHSNPGDPWSIAVLNCIGL